MLRWFARLAVVLGLVLGPALVINSGPARAADVDPRTGVLDGLWGVVQDPTTALDLIIGDLNRNGVPDPQEHSTMPAMGAAIAKVGGTPTQVQSGEKLAARACKTGWGCLGVLGTMVGLVAAGETADVWGPYIYTRFGDSSPLWSSPVAYYPGAKNNGSNWIAADPTGYAFYANDTTSTDRSGGAGDYSWTWTAKPPEYECRYGCNFTNQIGVDYVNPDGSWGHSTINNSQTIQARWYANNQGKAITEYNPWTRGRCILSGALCAVQGIEVRRVHFTGTGGYDRGFYWGQEVIPANGTLEALTRCKTPGGDFYDVLGTEPLATGQSPIKACNPGDEAVYIETTTIAPDGTRSPQTSQRLSSPADAAAVFPECSPGGSVYGGCTWSVKVNGVPCVKGSAACVDWASDKNSATCWYGPYQLTLPQCYWLERAYEHTAEPIPGTVPNTDGDPATKDGPTPQLQPTTAPSPSTTTTTTTQPSPTTTGSPGATPTPTPTPNPSASPSPSPTSSTSTGPSPSPSTSGSSTPSPSPSPGGGTSGSPDPSDAPGTRCWPSGWGFFNPSEWVLRPIGCALIPQPETVTTVRQSVGADVATSGAAALVDAVAAPLDAMGSASGCEGIVFDLPINGHTFHGSILNACEEPMATAAQVSTWLISLSVIVSGGLALLRLAGAGFGYNVKVMNDGD